MGELTGARQMSNVDKKAAKLEKQLRQWEKVRKSGKYAYILRWGGLCSICSACGDFWGYKSRHISFPKLGLGTAAYYLAIWLLTGFSTGLVLWLANEHRFVSSMKKQNPTKDDSRA